MVPCVRLLRIRCVCLFEEIRGAVVMATSRPAATASRQRAPSQQRSSLSSPGILGGEKIKNSKIRHCPSI